MIMPMSTLEKAAFNQQAPSLFRQMIELDYATSALLVKALAHSVKNADTIVRTWDENLFQDRLVLIEYFNKLTELISEEASKQKSNIVYSTTDLSRYTGTTVQTINNWVRDGRIEGVIRHGREHLRIPEDAVVMFPNGNRVPVSVLKQNWENENEEPVVDEFTYLKNSIQELSEKYDGRSFEEVFGSKTILELTPGEDTDASVWKSYLTKLKSVTGHT
ncbi:helix-turn-helix domain-containing protein [Cohnella silvisoli]|uniref:Helix-turn-helix domain-containing protein n=1 Tax=Cohnella silvisoli TaxID=2873699 RepID=A0ABV1KM21_9BACL|nr:helix-turn-helix domain-containing protein [Cohnella silvisoli]MCD9020786.1 helix-turn-helix domain-containing protein [Cohnella silvisoli]